MNVPVGSLEDVLKEIDPKFDREIFYKIFYTSAYDKKDILKDIFPGKLYLMKSFMKALIGSFFSAYVIKNIIKGVCEIGGKGVLESLARLPLWCYAIPFLVISYIFLLCGYVLVKRDYERTSFSDDFKIAFYYLRFIGYSIEDALKHLEEYFPEDVNRFRGVFYGRSR